MEKIKDTAQFKSGNVFVQNTVKKEPEVIGETGFKQNINNVLDYRAVKSEQKDAYNASDAAMWESESKQIFNFKIEAGDPEMVGRGMDCGLKGRIKEEETSQDSEVKNLFTFPLPHRRI